MRLPRICASDQGAPIKKANGINKYPKISSIDKIVLPNEISPKAQLSSAIIDINAISIAAIFKANFIPSVAPFPIDSKKLPSSETLDNSMSPFAVSGELVSGYIIFAIFSEPCGAV